MKTEFGQKRKNNKKQTMAILMAGAYCFGRFCGAPSMGDN